MMFLCRVQKHMCAKYAAKENTFWEKVSVNINLFIIPFKIPVMYDIQFNGAP